MPDTYRDVIAPGTTVCLGACADVKAVVIEVMLRCDGTTYHVAWWDDRTRRAEWVDEIELCNLVEKERVGFRQQAHCTI